MLTASYVLPLRARGLDHVDELAAYLWWLADRVDDVIVVDGSPREVFDAHAAALPPRARHVPPAMATPMGKVAGVLTGLDLARHDRVVVADDDVRYDDESLWRVVALLDGADVVRPANAFSPLPWHARLETGRILIGRATGGDWPGTLAVRRSALAHTGGYRGDVLFENLELVRTVQAGGGRERVASEVIVRRLPPTTRHYLGQRVRQAYDEWARPGRMALQLSVLPVVAAAAARRRPGVVVLLAGAAVAVAEVGRRTGGGRAAFPASSSLLAPVWVAERAVCSWLATAARFRRGVRYGDGRLTVAASSPRELAAGGRPVRDVWWAAGATTGQAADAPASATAGTSPPVTEVPQSDLGGRQPV